MNQLEFLRFELDTELKLAQVYATAGSGYDASLNKTLDTIKILRKKIKTPIFSTVPPTPTYRKPTPTPTYLSNSHVRGCRCTTCNKINKELGGIGY